MENKITTMEGGMQCRTELLLGKDNLEKIQSACSSSESEAWDHGAPRDWCAAACATSPSWIATAYA